MSFASARPRRSPAATAFWALGWGVLACNSAELPPESALGPAAAFEGPNFYESGSSEVPDMSDDRGDAPPIPASAPGFVGFVGGDEPASACAVSGRIEGEGPLDVGLTCPPIAGPAISDFAFAGGSATDATFGFGASFAGGTFTYGDGLRSQLTEGDWHLSGTVGSLSGFGLYLAGCKQIDASAYRGLAFSLRGSIAPGGSLVFFVGTASNQVSYRWLNENKLSSTDADEAPNLGRCVPVTNRYDGTCREARFTLPVSEEPTQVRVLWQQLSEGCPDPSVDPSELTAIAWYFPQLSTGPYTVDIHIDDLGFTDISPL
jgi:hypothetical protein